MNRVGLISWIPLGMRGDGHAVGDIVILNSCIVRVAFYRYHPSGHVDGGYEILAER